jgi:cell division protein FtsB
VRIEALPGEMAGGRSRFTGRGALLAVVVTALLLSLVVPLRTYLAQRDHLSKLEGQTRVLQRQNAILEAKVRQLHDPAYLERLARECLGMVRPGEIGFIVVPKDGESKPSGC